MQPAKFRAPYLTKNVIWEAADKLRDRFPNFAAPPVDVLKIAEIGLGMEFDLKPLIGLETVALLMRDLKTIVVDDYAFTEPNQLNRLRFSVAHELGHLQLHPNLYGQLNFKSTEQWKTFIARIPILEYQKVEFQAYEFAGRLLVPPGPLEVMNRETIALAKQEGYWELDDTRVAAFEFIARTICREFHVSKDVIEKRLVSEGFWQNRIE